MERLGLSIPDYDPKLFLSTVTIFSKRKCEDEEIETKYGNIKNDNSTSKTKKLKIENEEVSKDVSCKIELTSDVKIVKSSDG